MSAQDADRSAPNRQSDSMTEQQRVISFSHLNIIPAPGMLMDDTLKP